MFLTRIPRPKFRAVLKERMLAEYEAERIREHATRLATRLDALEELWADMFDSGQVQAVIFAGLADPGRFAPRVDGELWEDWQLRGVVAALKGATARVEVGH